MKKCGKKNWWKNVAKKFDESRIQNFYKFWKKLDKRLTAFLHKIIVKKGHELKIILTTNRQRETYNLWKQNLVKIWQFWQYIDNLD